MCLISGLHRPVSRHKFGESYDGLIGVDPPRAGHLQAIGFAVQTIQHRNLLATSISTSAEDFNLSEVTLLLHIVKFRSANLTHDQVHS